MKKRPAQKYSKLRKKSKLINRGNKKIFLKITAVSAIFIFASLFLTFLSFYRYLSQNFVSASSSSSTVPLVDDAVPTLAYVVVDDIDADSVTIVSLKLLVFDRSDKKILSYTVPINLKYDIAGKYGEEELSKIFMLAGLDSQEPLIYGENIINRTLTKIFGFKIDRFIITDKEKSEIFNDLLGNGSYLDIFRFKEVISSGDHFKTDLNVKEFYNLFDFIKSLPNDRLLEKTISSSDLTDTSFIDTDLSDITNDYSVTKEGKSISILNGTDVSGAAILGGRIVKNLGGRVVAINNTELSYKLGMLICDDVSSDTCKTLSHVFQINNIEKKGQTNLAENEIDRSDVVVIMGFDTVSSLY